MTDKEKRAVNSLIELSYKWPKSLWLFSANGSLYVMRNKKDGSRAFTPTGGVDQNYIVATIDIPNDGGDW